MSKPTAPNPAHKLASAASLLAPKHFRWVARAALEAMERETERLEQRVATVYVLQKHGAGFGATPDNLSELETSLAEHRAVVVFAKALDEAVAEIAATASVRGWKAAGAVLAKWMSGR
jgi:hypothetical protein